MGRGRWSQGAVTQAMLAFSRQVSGHRTNSLLCRISHENTEKQLSWRDSKERKGLGRFEKQGAVPLEKGYNRGWELPGVLDPQSESSSNSFLFNHGYRQLAIDLSH